MNNLNHLASIFGNKSALALEYVPALYQTSESPQYAAWRASFLPTAPKILKTETIAKRYGLDSHEPIRLIFALQSYYAIVIKLLAAYRLGIPPSDENIETGQYFREAGIANFCEEDNFSWYLGKLDLKSLHKAAACISYENAPPDALKAFYHDLFPRTLRHTLGEYYTPDWLAHFVLERMGYHGERRLLDPSCGSGTFLALAYRLLKKQGKSLNSIAGIDVNPLACLSAKANLLLSLDSWEAPLELPIYRADTLLNPPDLGKFDFVVGNPPWVNWETLPDDTRERSKALWLHYGLFTHRGFDSILGKGKKDLALLLTYAVMDKYLADDGKMAFILTQSVLKSSGAAEGFRRFTGKFQPQAVDDFSRVNLFSGAETRPIVLYLGKDKIEPIPYTLWHSPKKNIPDDAPASILESFRQSHFVAEPIGKAGSAWLTGRLDALQALRKLRGKTPYEAHAGVFTGGANGIYWLEILGEENGLLRVRNMPDAAKIAVPQVEALIEADFVFPLLRGRDVKRWQAIPTAHILVVQDPQRRMGYAESWLESHYPHTYTYLSQFEGILRQRPTLKRYFKADAPFYSMFDVGDYSFAPYKVLWHGFGKRTMAAAVVGGVEGKAIMSNQAMHPFIGLENEDEAHYLAACLNSIPFDYAVISHTQSGGKSFAQAAILKQLYIPKFQAEDGLHQALAKLSREAHAGKVHNEAIAEATAQLWELTREELAAISQSLREIHE
jgi:SAM-dependent methyltransferase